jgi:two-component system KDP operon response regulator KdpE
MNTCRILVASSRAEKRGELRAALELEGHDVAEAATAAETAERACAESHDVLVMESVVGGIAAHGLCRKIRTQSKLGIIVWGGNLGTTAIDSLNAGADDFIPAPFVLAELLARVRAILRRVARSSEKNQQIVLQDRAIDLRSHRIKGPGDREIHLTPKEFLVVKHLVSNANKLLTVQNLAQSVWRRDAGGEIEYVRVVIRQLRRKLEPDPDNPRYIHTERAAGYRFNLSPAESGVAPHEVAGKLAGILTVPVPARRSDILAMARSE